MGGVGSLAKKVAVSTGQSPCDTVLPNVSEQYIGPDVGVDGAGSPAKGLNHRTSGAPIKMERKSNEASGPLLL